MTKNEWREVRPIIENILAFILYLRFGTGSNLALSVTPASMLVLAKIFTTQFEQENHFNE